MKKFLMLVFAVVLAVSAVCFAEAPKAAEKHSSSANASCRSL